MDTRHTRLGTMVSKYTGHPIPYIRSLALSHVLRAGLLEKIFQYLDLPKKSRGLDLGCGIGLPACVLALLRADLTVCGMDISGEAIDAARHISQGAGAQVDFKTGSALDPGGDRELFDWVISIDCLGYIPALSGNALGQISQPLKPGGKIALAAWSSQQLLPGYPMLEAVLNATPRGIAPFEEGMDPELHFMKTGQTLSRAGFKEIASRAFTQSITGPLDRKQQAALRDLIRMRWGKNKRPGSESKELSALTDPASPGYILNEPCYTGHFTYTLFTGQYLPGT